MRARKKPDVYVAAAFELTPTDSRCEAIHPPAPLSTPT